MTVSKDGKEFERKAFSANLEAVSFEFSVSTEMKQLRQLKNKQIVNIST